MVIHRVQKNPVRLEKLFLVKVRPKVEVNVLYIYEDLLQITPPLIKNALKH